MSTEDVTERYKPVCALMLEDRALSDVVLGFVVRLTQRLQRFSESVERGDFAEIDHAAHNLRGAAASFGFHDLANTSRILERSAAQKDTAAVRRAFEALAEHTSEIQSAEVLALLKRARENAPTNEE